MNVTITAQDRQAAEYFLETYLTEVQPDGDFSKGSYLRDIVIASIAHVVAFLRAENGLALDRSSLKRITAMLPSTDRDEAADDALSNWFLTRRTGRPSRGRIIVHVTSKQDYVIPLTNKFYYNNSLTYVPDYTEDAVISEDEVIEVLDATSAVADRYFYLNVVSTGVGAKYDVSPATWLSWDAFSQYSYKVENTSGFVGGADTESTDEFLARAPDAIAVRDLNSERSLRATLRDRFPTVDDVVVIGAGAAEMQRDLVFPQPANLPAVHSGGCTDVYIKSPVQAASTYTVTLGGSFVEGRTEVLNFTSASIPDFVAGEVLPGYVLRIYNAQAGEPTLYVITAVAPDYLSVSPRSPFPEERTGVSYSVGNVHATYNNIIGQTADGVFTRTVSGTRDIILPQVPVYYIREVAYNNSGTWVPLTRNKYSSAEEALGASEYRLSYVDPGLAYTGYQIAKLTIGNTVPDGASVRVEYDTVAGFDTVHSYMADPFYRVACANVIAKALIPVYITLDLAYTVRTRATAALDEAQARQDIVDFINNFPADEVLNVSDIVSYIQSRYDTIIGSIASYDGANVIPFTLKYDLYAPDGRVVSYSHTNSVRIDPAREVTAPARLGVPTALGISERTVVYLTNLDSVSLTLVEES